MLPGSSGQSCRWFTCTLSTQSHFPTFSEFDVVLWLSGFLLTTALLVAVIVSCWVSNNPLAVYISAPPVPIPESFTTAPFLLLEVIMNKTSPVGNLGFPPTFGSGIVNVPDILPVEVVIKGLPRVGELSELKSELEGVTKALTSVLLKNTYTLVFGLKCSPVNVIVFDLINGIAALEIVRKPWDSLSTLREIDVVTPVLDLSVLTVLIDRVPVLVTVASSLEVTLDWVSPLVLTTPDQLVCHEFQIVPKLFRSFATTAS